MSQINFSDIAFSLPEDYEKETIKTNLGDLVIREPFAADYAIVEETKDMNMHQRTFSLALRLAVSLNGEPGIAITDIGKLDRESYKRLTEKMSQFFLDAIPDNLENSIQKYISSKLSKFSES